MKSISKIFGLMLTIAVAFSSCSSDDDGPAPVRQEKDVTYTYTAVIKGLAPTNGGKIEYNLPDLTLVDILGETDARNFLSGEFQNAGTYMEVSGLKDMATSPSLANFTLQVNTNTAVNFGTCKVDGTGNNEFSSDTQQSGNKYVTFISPIFTSVVSNSRKASLKISFTPTADIQATDNVVLKIAITGKYRYNTYPTTAK